MRSYVEEVEWLCGWCWSRQEFRYLGSSASFCSNVCKQRARKVERSLEAGKKDDWLLEEVRGWEERRYTALRKSESPKM